MKKFILLTAIAAMMLSPFALRSARAADGETVSLPIVMYHHISLRPETWNDYVISRDEFAADLSWLRSHGYTPVSVAQLLAWEQGEFEMPDKPCMITFDDGFLSTMTYAEPLLAEYGFCGACAVIGSVCEKFSALDEHEPEYDNLSWEDAAAMAERGTVEVICHTWDMHAMSPRLGCRKLRGEDETAYRYRFSDDLGRFLRAAKARGVPLTPAIAYPYGAYSRETTQALRDFGVFSAAFTCEEKINRLTGAAGELYALGRYNRPHGISSEEFFSKWEENS